MSLTLLPEISEVRDSIRPYKYLATLQILDVLTTGFILSAWSVRAEGNPLVGFMLHTVGLYPGLTLLLILKLAAVYFFYICQTGVKLMSAVYNLVLINNFLFIFIWLWN